jgi:hypothetical protein
MAANSRAVERSDTPGLDENEFAPLPGCGILSGSLRGYRSAQPPAIRCHASGMKECSFTGDHLFFDAFFLLLFRREWFSLTHTKTLQADKAMRLGFHGSKTFPHREIIFSLSRKR